MIISASQYEWKDKSLKNVHECQNILAFNVSSFMHWSAWTPQVSVQPGDSCYSSMIWQCSQSFLWCHSLQVSQLMLNGVEVWWLWHTHPIFITHTRTRTRTHTHTHTLTLLQIVDGADPSTGEHSGKDGELLKLTGGHPHLFSLRKHKVGGLRTEDVVHCTDCKAHWGNFGL